MNDYRLYLTPGKAVHLIGIGGVSMCALAESLHDRGMLVSGSDMNESAATQHLRELGITVRIGHFAENIKGAELAIRTAAVHDDNEEVIALRENNIPLLERAQAWGALMLDCKNAICISGTHGKTTTTSMMTHVAMAAGLDPTVMIGGTLPLIGSGHRVGGGKLMVMEACEYCNSFLNFHPTIAAILNVEADHLDFFKDLDDVIASFRAFALRVPEKGGAVVYNIDDEGACRSVSGIPRRLLGCGLSENADVRAERLNELHGAYGFTVTIQGVPYADIQLKVPGLHNVHNALSVCACAWLLGIPGGVAAEGLGRFTGAARRFEDKGMYNGARIVDDYAHHPGEIAATLIAAKEMGYDRIICAFQPHTYTRTAALFDDFRKTLSLADLVYVSEIYAAREKNPNGMSAASLADAIPNAVFCPTLDDVSEKLKNAARPNDLIITMGAGDIYLAGERMVNCQFA